MISNLNALCNSKVNELENTRDEEEVGGLQVTMNDALLMNRLNSLKHLLPDQSQVVVIDGTFLIAPVLQHRSKIHISALHHNVEKPLLSILVICHKLNN